MTYLVYGIPNCDTVKKALAWLKARQIPYQFHDYKKQGLDPARLDGWLAQRPWDQLVNRSGTTWRQLPEGERPTDVASARALMLRQTSVIRRPLVELDGQIVALGFAEAEYAQRFA
ncbi:MAG: arsenate reductase [Bernardetiaceae bacterium]|jgi:Spx/MgsR family transcriptional regulator|nr:arsenate reductase [Bernardetiaceae bacterium]